MQRRAIVIPAKDWAAFEAWADRPANKITALEHLAADSRQQEMILPRLLAETDDRNSFDCGRSSLNLWFWHHAWAEHAAGVSRVHVTCDGAGEIVGYVTLSAAQIEPAGLPGQPNGPDPLPATLLGQLAIRTDCRGKGYGGLLLLFALRAALRVSHDIGSFAIIVQPFDGRMRAFYRKWGFQDAPFAPERAMILRMADLEQSWSATEPVSSDAS
jgi:GNAT superfamily N-acetyltransferase